MHNVDDWTVDGQNLDFHEIQLLRPLGSQDQFHKLENFWCRDQPSRVTFDLPDREGKI